MHVLKKKQMVPDQARPKVVMLLPKGLPFEKVQNNSEWIRANCLEGTMFSNFGTWRVNTEQARLILVYRSGRPFY